MRTNWPGTPDDRSPAVRPRRRLRTRRRARRGRVRGRARSAITTEIARLCYRWRYWLGLCGQCATEVSTRSVQSGLRGGTGQSQCCGGVVAGPVEYVAQQQDFAVMHRQRGQRRGQVWVPALCEPDVLRRAGPGRARLGRGPAQGAAGQSQAFPADDAHQPRTQRRRGAQGAEAPVKDDQRFLRGVLGVLTGSAAASGHAPDFRFRAGDHPRQGTGITLARGFHDIVRQRGQG